MTRDEGPSSTSPMENDLSLVPPHHNPVEHQHQRDTFVRRGLFLAHLLLTCLAFVASGNLANASMVLDQISQLASPNGDAMQRVAAHFISALAHRIIRVWPGLYRALNATAITPTPGYEKAVRKMFFELCPFLRLSYLMTNEAIMEAMEGEKVVHIIDLSSSEHFQWLSLLHAMSTRPEGPPHLRLTGVHENRVVLEKIARQLNAEAEKLDIPFQFNPIVSKLEDLEIENLHVKMGEALAICSVLQLHRLLAFDCNLTPVAPTTTSTLHSTALSSSPKIITFLSALRGLSPKIMVITEKDSDHNGLLLEERSIQALNYYAALFDCMESTIPRASVERQKVEQLLFGEEIKNIVSCEGVERKERHEKLDKWIARLQLCGFRRERLSYTVMMHGNRLLLDQNNHIGYNIKDRDGCFFICWQEYPIFSISAWSFYRYNGVG